MKSFYVNLQFSFLFALKKHPHVSSEFSKKQLLFNHLFNLMQGIKVPKYIKQLRVNQLDYKTKNCLFGKKSGKNQH